MAQAGWYADPGGSGGIRWWDGSQWTEHVQPAPSAPPMPAVLDKRVLGSRLYADSRVISYGRDSVDVATAHWVCYSVAQLDMRTGLFELGGTTPISAEWRFSVGHYPFRKTPSVHMIFTSESAETVPEEWAFLVNLSHTHIEPRLVTELVNRIRNGETVNVGEGVQVNAGGFSGGKIALPWASVAGTSSADGHIWVYQAGVQKPALRVPQQNPNAVLIPPLFDILMRS